MIDEQFLQTIPQYGIGGFVGKVFKKVKDIIKLRFDKDIKLLKPNWKNKKEVDLNEDRLKVYSIYSDLFDWEPNMSINIEDELLNLILDFYRNIDKIN